VAHPELAPELEAVYFLPVEAKIWPVVAQAGEVVPAERVAVVVRYQVGTECLPEFLCCLDGYHIFQLEAVKLADAMAKGWHLKLA
jgi:hypothetical protein